MGAEQAASLVATPPTSIDQLEEARAVVLSESEAYRAFEQAFYASLEGGKGEPRKAAVGRYLLGQTDAAVEALGSADDELAAFIRAQQALEQAHWDEALRRIGAVLKARPDSLAARRVRVEALLQLSDQAGLEKELKELEARHAEHADVHYLQGLIHELEGDYEEASRLYWQTLTVDAGHQGALFRLAYHEGLRGEAETAIDLYERLVATRPVPVGALINLGLLFEDAEDYSLAANCFQRVLDFNPNHQRARLYYRDALASQGMYYDEERERKEDKRAQVMRIPVTDFELSVRSRNCLANMNVRTLGDLIRLSEQELLAFKNFGETSLTEIKEILAQKGLRLGMTPTEEALPPPMVIPAGDRDVMLRPVSELDLSVRSRKALEFLNIKSIAELTQVPEGRLLACKNFGQTSLTEIKKKLRDLGLALKEG